MSNTGATHTRVAVVTGAAQGIGEAVALRLADDGYDIAVFDLPAKRAQVDAVVQTIQGKGRRAISVLGDASLETDVQNLVDRSVEQLGGLDVMVANAGIVHSSPILDMAVEEYDNIMAVNARSVMLAIKHAGRHMVKQGKGGRIIAAASLAAKQGVATGSAYCASKFAIRGLVQSAALELREHDITVNSYAPGLIITPLSTRPEDELNGGPGSTLIKQCGLPYDYKPGMPDEVAALVSYLARPEARYVTGQSIDINGGMRMD
ncbi:NAD-P-binding protein [Trametes sanguinea]|nr:NAD-P-binding protein [Trametes sanguinea]